MHPRLERALPGGEADDLRLMSRALGAMLLCAGLILLAGTALTPPGHANAGGIQAVGVLAVVGGGVAFLSARRARTWTAHLVFASGSVLICLGTYFTGAATGIYAVLLVWLAIFAAGTFSSRSVAVHVVAIMFGSVVTLAMIGPSPGPPPVVRAAVGGVLLTLAATIMGRIAARRRANEAFLHAQIGERDRLQHMLEHLADHDPLTGVANRRRLDQELSRELSRARREGTPLCVVTMDLDGLKEHNDTYGHAAGDQLLKHVAATWSSRLRATDVIARTGGDEFVILLPDCPLETAEDLIGELRGAIAARGRCSAGAAIWDGREPAAALQARADVAMYAAKASSRQRPGAMPHRLLGRAGSPVVL